MCDNSNKANQENCDTQKEEGLQSKEFTFNYPWETVMKAYWDKYPDQSIDFVKWNKVIGFDINPDGSIQFKRVIMIKKFYFIWAYGLEELTFNFKDKIMDMKTSVLKKSR